MFGKYYYVYYVYCVYNRYIYVKVSSPHYVWGYKFVNNEHLNVAKNYREYFTLKNEIMNGIYLVVATCIQ